MLSKKLFACFWIGFFVDGDQVGVPVTIDVLVLTIGLFGLASYGVAQRTQEIGVRHAHADLLRNARRRSACAWRWARPPRRY